MKRSTICASIAAALMLLSAGMSHAAEGKAQQAETTASKIAKKDKAAHKTKLVDINDASKKELMTLPGISADYADKIIAGRPYGSKAWLVTHKILPIGVYDGFNSRIIAKQPYAEAGKNAEIYRKVRKNKE